MLCERECVSLVSCAFCVVTCVCLFACECDKLVCAGSGPRVLVSADIRMGMCMS